MKQRAEVRVFDELVSGFLIQYVFPFQMLHYEERHAPRRRLSQSSSRDPMRHLHHSNSSPVSHLSTCQPRLLAYNSSSASDRSRPSGSELARTQLLANQLSDKEQMDNIPLRRHASAKQLMKRQSKVTQQLLAEHFNGQVNSLQREHPSRSDLRGHKWKSDQHIPKKYSLREGYNEERLRCSNDTSSYDPRSLHEDPRNLMTEVKSKQSHFFNSLFPSKANRFGYPVYPERELGIPSGSGPVSFAGFRPGCFEPERTRSVVNAGHEETAKEKQVKKKKMFLGFF